MLLSSFRAQQTRTQDLQWVVSVLQALITAVRRQFHPKGR